MYTAKYAALNMSKNKPVNERGEKGLIMFVSSVASEEGQRGQVAYSASKGAINGMLMPMSRDLGRFGIRVLAIAPGVFESPMSSMMNEKTRKGLLKDTPMGRLGNADEFAHLAGSCIENGYLNGVVIRIDGATKLSN
jgi:3-hydroxyacyl-CoA dehydrogenase